MEFDTPEYWQMEYRKQQEREYEQQLEEQQLEECPGADYSENGKFECAYGYTVKCSECTVRATNETKPI